MGLISGNGIHKDLFMDDEPAKTWNLKTPEGGETELE
jgi:hypothetical protein